MSVTHTITGSWSNGGATISKVMSFSGSELNFNDTIAGATTDQEVDIAFVLARMNSVFMYTDQDITIKTNSSGSPAKTFVLKAGDVVVWTKNSPLPNPFVGADVTKLYITNAGATAANVLILINMDVTP